MGEDDATEVFAVSTFRLSVTNADREEEIPVAIWMPVNNTT
jgi:hypothetical protein